MAPRIKIGLLTLGIAAILTVLTGVTALNMPAPVSIQGMAGNRPVEECGDPYRVGFPISGGANYRGPCTLYRGTSIGTAIAMDLLIWMITSYLLVTLIYNVLRTEPRP